MTEGEINNLFWGGMLHTVKCIGGAGVVLLVVAILWCGATGPVFVGPAEAAPAVKAADPFVGHRRINSLTDGDTGVMYVYYSDGGIHPRMNADGTLFIDPEWAANNSGNTTNNSGNTQ